jgi:Ca2+:H+ antiporter
MDSLSSSLWRVLSRLARWAVLAMVPLAVLVHIAAPERHLLLFGVSALGIIPLAGMMGHATEVLAQRFGSGVGGILNATLGNAAELIIAIVALRAGQVEMVKASITGSIIGNILFVLGAAMLVGGLGRTRQTFNAQAAGTAASMMLLAVAALLLPTFFHLTVRDETILGIQRLSAPIAAVLLLTYGLSLVFTLKTHKHLYAEAEEPSGPEAPRRGLGGAVGALLASTVLIAVLSEYLVASAEYAAKALHLSDVFIGVMVIAVVGNAAEHSTAVLVARKDKMNLAITIAVESSRQIALFVAPVLVLLGLAFRQPMTLEFSLLEVGAVGVAVLIVNSIAQDGESNWLEGAMLLAMYLILGITFYFLR